MYEFFNLLMLYFIIFFMAFITVDHEFDYHEFKYYFLFCIAWLPDMILKFFTRIRKLRHKKLSDVVIHYLETTFVIDFFVNVVFFTLALEYHKVFLYSQYLRFFNVKRYYKGTLLTMNRVIGYTIELFGWRVQNGFLRKMVD